VRLATAEARTLEETLVDRDEKIRRLERLADEYRSRQSQVGEFIPLPEIFLHPPKNLLPTPKKSAMVRV